MSEPVSWPAAPQHDAATNTTTHAAVIGRTARGRMRTALMAKRHAWSGPWVTTGGR
jgi:hypothetical protein